MTSIYHGGAKIEGQTQSPFFLYEDISSAIYYVTGYSGIVDNHHVSEYQLNNKAKVLDLVANQEFSEQIIDKIMKKIGIEFENEYLYVKGSNDKVGHEVYGYDINLTFYPEFREELLKEGFNVLRSYSAFENTSPIGYAVLDSSALNLTKEYQLQSDDEGVCLTVTQDNTTSNQVGKSFEGATGYGDIQLKEKASKKKKM